MPLSIRCKSCTKSIRVPSKYEGKKVKCPGCGATLKIPSLDRTQHSSAATAPDAADNDPFANLPSPGDPSEANDLFSQDFNSELPSAAVAAVPASNAEKEDFWAPKKSTKVKKTIRDERVGATASLGESAIERQAAASLALESERAERMEKGEGGSLSTKLFVVAAAMLLIGPVVAYSGYRKQADLRLLNKEGVTVPAIIVEGVERVGRRFSRSYSFRVEFQRQDGEIQMEKMSVSRSMFNEHCSDDEIVQPFVEVRYAPSEPRIAYIVGNEPSAGLMFFGGSAACLLGLAGCILLAIFPVD